MKWRHNICVNCWNDKNPGRTAFKMTTPPDDTCCYCGEESNSGIYVRDDPRKMKCKHGKRKQ